MKRVAGMICVAAVIVGCGQKVDEPRGTVTGRVTVGGTPVNGGIIQFASVEPGVERSAPIGPDGTFEVKSFEDVGLPPGSYQVAVRPGRFMQPGEEIPFAGQEPAAEPPPSVEIPRKYHRVTTSQITIDVQVGENPPYQLTLIP